MSRWEQLSVWYITLLTDAVTKWHQAASTRLIENIPLWRKSLLLLSECVHTFTRIIRLPARYREILEARVFWLIADGLWMREFVQFRLVNGSRVECSASGRNCMLLSKVRQNSFIWLLKGEIFPVKSPVACRNGGTVALAAQIVSYLPRLKPETYLPHPFLAPILWNSWRLRDNSLPSYSGSTRLAASLLSRISNAWTIGECKTSRGHGFGKVKFCNYFCGDLCSCSNYWSCLTDFVANIPSFHVP